MKPLSGLADIFADYDLFLLDLWGVVHDGTAMYPGARETLKQLADAGKKVIFISNAPRRASAVTQVLSGFGVMQSWYHAVVSSGEVGYQWLAAGNAPWGKRYYFIGASKDVNTLDGLDCVRVDDIKQADFILNLGFGTEEQTSDDFTMLLRAGKAQGLPMLCLNPDLEVVKITGERFPCAGVLGKIYAQMGGNVTWFGKPYAEIYEYCFALLPTEKHKILAVGDSLETDIPGGKTAGIDTLLITGGLLKNESPQAIASECSKLGLAPRFCLPKLAI